MSGFLPLPGSPAFLLLCLAALLLAINLATYAVFGLDKARAVRGQWRVPEQTLLLLALCGGWPGAKLAQRRFRHKTRKQPFRGLLNAVGAVQAVALVLLVTPVGAWGLTAALRGAEAARAALDLGAQAATGWAAQAQGAAVQAATLIAPEPAQPEPAARPLPRRFGPGSDAKPRLHGIAKP